MTGFNHPSARRYEPATWLPPGARESAEPEFYGDQEGYETSDGAWHTTATPRPQEKRWEAWWTKILREG